MAELRLRYAANQVTKMLQIGFEPLVARGYWRENLVTSEVDIFSITNSTWAATRVTVSDETLILPCS